MKRKRVSKRAAVTAAAAAAIGPAAAAAVLPEATEASPPPYCPANAICLYRDVNFAGSIAYFSPGGEDSNYAAHDGYAGNTFVDGSPLNDRVSAIWNNSNRVVTFCTNANCVNGNAALCLRPGVALWNITFGVYDFNEKLSAHYTSPGQAGTLACTVEARGPQGCSI